MKGELNMKVIPSKNNILLTPVLEDSKIIITKVKPDYYSVAAVGPDVESFQVGDTVLVADFGGKHVDIEGVDHVIVKEDAILAKII